MSNTVKSAGGGVVTDSAAQTGIESLAAAGAFGRDRIGVAVPQRAGNILIRDLIDLYIATPPRWPP